MSNRIRINYRKTFIRLPQNGMSGIFEDVTDFLSTKKEEGKQWVDENIGGGASNIVESIGKDALNKGKEQVVDLVTGRNNEDKSGVTAQRNTPIVSESDYSNTVPTRTTTSATNTATTTGSINFLQKFHPGITFLTAGVITAWISKKPGWTLAIASVLAIGHNAYRVNRQNVSA